MVRLLQELATLQQNIHIQQRTPVPAELADETAPLRLSLPASIPTGIGAAPLPDVEDASTMSVFGNPSTARLAWSSIYFAGELCTERILRDVAQTHEVLVIKRGGCTFSQKVSNIPNFYHSPSSLALVVVVDEGTDDEGLVSPSLDETQFTPSGLPRYNPIPLVLVRAGEGGFDKFVGATGMGIRRLYHVQSRGTRISNLRVR